MVKKEKQNAELFDLCKKAAAMKQIEIASFAKDCKKTVGGKITKKWEQMGIRIFGYAVLPILRLFFFTILLFISVFRFYVV